MRFLLFIYIILVAGLIINKLYIAAILSTLLIPITIYINKYIKKTRVEKYRKRIAEATDAFRNNKKIEPFINVNIEHWSIIELIPGVSRVRAKTLANNVKTKKITTFNEFADMCNLEPGIYNFVKTIIKF